MRIRDIRMTMPLVGVTFKHILDEDAALSDLLVNDELLIIGSYEKDHGYREMLKGIRLWSVLKMRVGGCLDQATMPLRPFEAPSLPRADYYVRGSGCAWTATAPLRL